MKLRIVVTEGPDKGRMFVFESRDRFVVGRSPDASLSVSRDPYFSRHHFLLEIDPPNVLLRDLKSANGTFLNDFDERVKQAQLRDGDVIRAGQTRIKLELRESEPATSDEDPSGAAGRSSGGSAGGFSTGGSSSGSSAGGSSSSGSAPSFERSPSGGPQDVRCTRCGVRAARERARTEPVTYFCESCRAELLAQPVLSPGYRLVRELGRGSMGAAYLATEEATGALRAVKIVVPHAALSEESRKGFLRDASEQTRLVHPRIVKVFDLRESTPGVFCSVMEYVEGGTAEQLLAGEGSGGLDPKKAATIVAQALEGLDFAHAAGVIHRDVKETNILLAGSSAVDVKLTDFGLARSFATSGASGFVHGPGAGAALSYMPPEQILNFREVKPAGDIYAMGAVLYRLLSGGHPIELGSRDLFLAVLEDPIVPLQKRRADVPAALAAVAERALEKRPQSRFATAAEMRAAILAAMP